MLLAVVNAKNVDQQFLIYFVVPISIVDRPNVVITDASANTDHPPQFYSGAQHLENLNWKAIDSKKWSMPSDAEKQARMAEVLVHQSVDLDLITEVIVWNPSIEGIVRKMFKEAGRNPPSIITDSHHYYTKWPEDSAQSLVTGPFFIKRAYTDAIKHISDTGQNPGARFKNTAALLAGLREDFACLLETAELVGLMPDNEVHTETAGDHTLSVVKTLVKSKEFKELNETDQRLTEIAAYLHDIGKGPKSRWAKNGGKQKPDPDHSIGSVNMLRRILTVELQEINSRSTRVLAKLVCYHDLIGEIVGKGRAEEQLHEIAGSERELDMLIALSLADMQAIQPYWIMIHRDSVNKLRIRVLAALAKTPDSEED